MFEEDEQEYRFRSRMESTWRLPHRSIPGFQDIMAIGEGFCLVSAEEHEDDLGREEKPPAPLVWPPT